MKHTLRSAVDSLPPIGKTLVLVGLMGAGKSTVGRRLAKILSLEFKDTDSEIIEAAGCGISDIFEIHGEAIFRDLEKRVVSRIIDGKPAVIATGGGVFINADLRALIRERAISIWLRADLDVLLERVSRRNTRPLLEAGDKRGILSRLMEERYSIYAEADIVVDSNDGAHEEVVEKIIHALAARMAGRKAAQA